MANGDGDGDGDGDDEQRAEAVPNEIPNDCDRATELVPKEIKNDHRAYRIVYRMASQETVEITTKRPLRSHSDGYHCQGLHMEIEREDYREPNRTKPLMEMFTEWHTK